MSKAITIVAIGALGLAAAGVAQAQVYCSAPAGYVALNSAGDGIAEYGTDAFYNGYIGPSPDVSTTGTNCTPLTSWPYYTLTDPPGDAPPTGPQLGLSSSPSTAPEIDPAGTIAGLTILAGLVLISRGRRLT